MDSVLYIKFTEEEYPRALQRYTGKDCMKVLCKVLEKEARTILRWPQKEMDPLTTEEQESYDAAKTCYLCGAGGFGRSKKDRKVRDHNHYTGKYRGAAHGLCNLRYKLPQTIPIVFHNLSNYDGHLIIRELANRFGSENMKCIGENKEKYISFSVKIKEPRLDENGSQMIVKNKKGKLEKKWNYLTLTIYRQLSIFWGKALIVVQQICVKTHLVQ